MSRVLGHIVARYRDSSAGRTGCANRDLLFPFNNLLKEAECAHGPERYEAISELERFERLGILILERHTRDHSAILKIRLPIAQASALFRELGLPSPERERELLAKTFQEASFFKVPIKYQQPWEVFCREMAQAARTGASLQPFDRTKPQQIETLMGALPSILAWEGESLMRFASAQLFKSSKFLESARLRIERCLSRISGKSVTLADFGILENERSFLIHGPVSLHLGKGTLHLGLLRTVARVGAEDIRRSRIETSGSRCVTVENAAMLHELAKLSSGTLLASSGSEGGFANSAVIAFLKALPMEMELWHFGDSDPKGFDILRDLRERTGREIRSLHMSFRASPPEASNQLVPEDRRLLARLLSSDYLTGSEKAHISEMLRAGHKGDFEQERLGRPSNSWPFY